MLRQYQRSTRFVLGRKSNPNVAPSPIKIRSNDFGRSGEEKVGHVLNFKNRLRSEVCAKVRFSIRAVSLRKVRATTLARLNSRTRRWSPKRSTVIYLRTRCDEHAHCPPHPVRKTSRTLPVKNAESESRERRSLKRRKTQSLSRSTPAPRRTSRSLRHASLLVHPSSPWDTTRLRAPCRSSSSTPRSGRRGRWPRFLAVRGRAARAPRRSERPFASIPP